MRFTHIDIAVVEDTTFHLQESDLYGDLKAGNGNVGYITRGRDLGYDGDGVLKKVIVKKLTTAEKTYNAKYNKTKNRLNFALNNWMSKFEHLQYMDESVEMMKSIILATGVLHNISKNCVDGFQDVDNYQIGFYESETMSIPDGPGATLRDRIIRFCGN